MAVILSLDIGTSKVCSLALSLKTLKPMAVHSMANAADVADLAEGRYEQNPRRIREGCLELLARVCRDPAVNSDEVVGIGVTGQMHGVLLVDGTLEPLTNLITWRDQRALETDLSLIRPDADDLSRCGCGLHAGYGGATLHWLGKGELIPAGARALTIADFVVSSLTGEIATEPTHAASWGLYNLGTNDWDDIMVERLGLSRDVLAPVIATATRQGGLTQRCANALGLAADTPVCASMGDNQASVIGAAGFAERTAVLNLGTGTRTTVNELWRGAVATCGHDPDSWPVSYEELRPGDQRHMQADITRAREALGWSPRTSMEQGMAATVAWARTDAGSRPTE